MKFLIFTKYRCSYCDRAKALIELKGYEYESINIAASNMNRPMSSLLDQLLLAVTNPKRYF